MKYIPLAFSSGILLILCFPSFNVGYLSWFALVPLLLAIKGRDLKSAFGLSLLTGMIFYPGVFYWFKIVKGVSWIDFTCIGIYLSTCYFGIFGLLFNFIAKKTELPSIITAPVLWVSLEYVRSYAGFVSHPQMLLCHSQYLNLPIIQISSYTGSYGISFLIVMVNIAICEIILNRSKALKPALVTVIILGVSIMYGLSVMKKGPGSDTVSITVIQGNISRDMKWERKYWNQNLQKHVRLTKEAINLVNPKLIVWPETSVQGSLKHNLYYLQTISTLARESKTYILFGSSQRPKSGSRELRRKKIFNSAFLISPEGKIEGQYNKIRLVPFGEYLPHKDLFPWPSRLIAKAGNFIQGTEYTLFNLDNAQFGTLICWENIFPELFRKVVKKGANFMINITNEVWLEDTSAPYQMAAISVFRAAENRIPIVRSANTGVSCFINPYGKIIGRVHDQNNKATFVEGFLTKEIPLSHEKTFYTKYGDIFAYMNLLMTLFMLSFSLLKKK